jgi:hypothetical protein
MNKNMNWIGAGAFLPLDCTTHRYDSLGVRVIQDMFSSSNSATRSFPETSPRLRSLFNDIPKPNVKWFFNQDEAPVLSPVIMAAEI